MKKVLIVLGAVVVLIIAALVALPALIPAERIQNEVVAGVKNATGRDLSIQGKVSVSAFPSLSVQVGNVALANPPGYTSKDLIRLGAVDVRLKLMPLLGGKVEVDSFVLVDPVITLETDRQGKGNWVFDGPTASSDKPAAAAQSKPAADKPAAAPSAGLNDIRLGDVRITNGKLTQIDGKTGARQEVSEINLQVALKSLSEPLSAKGSLVWNAKKIELSLGVASLKALMDGQSSALDIAVTSEPLKLGLKGNAKGGAAPGVDGMLDLGVPSIRNLAAWAGSPITMAGNGLGPLSINGKLVAGPTQIAFTQASIAIDAIKAKGDVTVNTGGAKPAVKGRLDVDMLDVNPYLPPDGAPSKGGDGKAAAGAPQQGQAKAHQGWSDDPIDASGLKAADVDFSLTCAGILVKKIKVGKSALKLVIKDGKLAADLTELALYQGAGKGRVALDGSMPGVGLDASFQLKGLQAEPFLNDAADTDRLSGTGNFDVAVTGQGKTQRQIVSSLNGKGALTFLNGAIKGINLAAMARNVATAFTGGAASSEKTDFAELGGTFTIAKGILTNNDLALKSPLLRVEGKGTVDLPQRSVNYRIDPKVVASLEGQGGGNAAGVVVPILVTGPWDNLSYRPDLEALLKQNVQNVGKAVEGLIPGAIGGKSSGSSPTDKLNPLKLFGR
ncbi:AsmA family protein [Magnetospirillum sp. 15-1]|uniref:AsmA family protein n=1 Tax=Magnetospirillum sp. 15-1 TaxID=1979370 RepID=UPI000BBC0624|nr:AsmA family protein [Magnetospirillum sp. 15-1]